MITVTSYLGIGSNLGDRINNIKESIRLIKLNRRIKVKSISSVYETSPYGGPKNQPKYLNIAIGIKTGLAPFDLLKELKEAELKLKRVKTAKWGSRTIDLDILFYGDLVFFSKTLTIPHPFLHKRAFVLRPLSDIASNLMHPLYKKSIRFFLNNLKTDERVISFAS
jgi:2-amino-4-hydroxy-6-hydroxymethyldihydropteridine diphosphokinase